ATALALAEQGAAVVVTDTQLDRMPDGRPAVNTDAMSILSAEIEARGPGSMAIEVDITNRHQIDACIEQVVARFGRIDILVNNAGTTVGALPFLDITSGQWDLSYRVNLKGTADFCQATLPSMIENRSGVIVNNVSTAGLGAEAGFGAYNATKHGVVGLTKTIAAEFGPAGVRCNAVCPGYVSTAMHLEATARLAREAGVSIGEMAEQRYKGVALRRPGSPEEIASTIVFLAGPGSEYITGAAIPVSGGTPVGL
ncbi:MAG: SDR family oxidoreductase, partial [bacterium]|nr:SDR family oxidoreductase [bacterium]